MRELPDLGAFDLVTCLDDAVNYLLGDDDLVRALRSMGGRLAPGGVLVFDTNTLATYDADYGGDQVVEDDGVFMCWRGHGVERDASGAHRAAATIEIFRPTGNGRWEREQSVHRQRHRGRAEVEHALAAAGLRALAVKGQRRGAVLEDELDERVHTKALFVAGRALPSAAEGGAT